jgi:hypothetical protein
VTPNLAAVLLKSAARAGESLIAAMPLSVYFSS